MRFPRYWTTAKDNSGQITARGWSDSSIDEAERNARARLQRVLQWLESGDPDSEPGRYPYVIDDSICEQIIDHVYAGDGREIAVVSRNAYGTLVLNASSVMIIDIDIESTIPRPGLLGRLFGARRPSAAEVFESELNHIRDWQQRNPEVSLRIYRTAAGIRAIVTDREFFEVDSEVLRIMDELHSDPLYRQLCVSQSCFRARLCPKPWRIGMANPPCRFPFENPASETAYERWSQEYFSKCAHWAVCEYLETFGSGATTDVAGQIVDLHDSFCCSVGKKLA